MISWLHTIFYSLIVYDITTQLNILHSGDATETATETTTEKIGEKTEKDKLEETREKGPRRKIGKIILLFVQGLIVLDLLLCFFLRVDVADSKMQYKHLGYFFLFIVAADFAQFVHRFRLYNGGNQRLVKEGIYRFCAHPQYYCLLVELLCIVLCSPNFKFVTFFSETLLLFSFAYIICFRIPEEENILRRKFGQEWTEYKLSPVFGRKKNFSPKKEDTFDFLPTVDTSPSKKLEKRRKSF